MEKKLPPLVAAPPPLPKGKHVTGFSGRLGSPTNPVRWSDSSSFATPVQGALWTLAVVLHDSVGKHREVLFCPPDGGKSGAAG